MFLHGEIMQKQTPEQALAMRFYQSPVFAAALQAVMKVLDEQSRGSLEDVENPAYLFRRKSDVPTDSGMLQGRGPPANRCGLI